jgi:hypothetical protein
VKVCRLELVKDCIKVFLCGFMSLLDHLEEASPKVVAEPFGFIVRDDQAIHFFGLRRSLKLFVL